MANGHATDADGQGARTGVIGANDVVAANWTDLNDRLFADAWDAEIGRFRSRFAYRGMASSAYDLTTSLTRLGGAYHALEAHMLRNFIKYARHTQLPGASPWHWLALAQHHGLPTRMLDWTFSPYVALHFATTIDRAEEIETDAIVWCVDYVQTNTRVPDGLRAILDDEDAGVFTAEMLAPRGGFAHRLRYARAGAVRHLLRAALARRPDRQSGRALLADVQCDRPARSLARGAPGDVPRASSSPPRLKHEVRDKLDQANITERVLFPGLDGLSRWMRRYYAPPVARGAFASATAPVREG